MGTVSQASSTALTLQEVYKAAGEDYTGLAEYSDVAGYQNGTNDYTIKEHGQILAQCSGLKPNTQVWPRLDGKNLSPYCRMSNSTSFGGDLVTDSKGNLDFYYKIPNDANMKFRGLKHLLEVSDVKPPGSGAASTYGISSGKIGATTRCGQYLYFPSNKDGFDSDEVKQTSNVTLTELLADKSKTIVSSTQVEEEVPDFMSQGFSVSEKDVDGIFGKRVYLYFSDKPTDPDSFVTVQIRKAGKNNIPTDEVIAESERVYIDNSYNDDSTIAALTGAAARKYMVNATSDASLSTIFRFPKAVKLKNNHQYVLTVIPHEPKSEFKVWTAVKNSADVRTNVNANFSPIIGSLYGSASGNVWSRLPGESIKFIISAEEYITNTTSEFVFENEDLEFLNISDISPQGEKTSTTGFHVDERVRGESLLTIDHTQPLSVGDKLQNEFAKDNPGSIGSASFANGTIRSIGTSGATGTTGSTGVVTVKIDACGDFDGANREALFIGSTQVGLVGATGTTGGFVANSCLGYASFVNTDFGRLRLERSTADSSTENKFQAGKYVRGQSYGASAKIDAVVDPKIDEIDIRTQFTSGYATTLDWYIKTTDAGTTSIDADWERITGGKQLKFTDKQKQVYSKSNQSFKSILIKGEMSTTDKNVSPAAEIDEMTVVAKRQRINNSTADETKPAGQSTARYVSKVLRANNLNPVTGDAIGQPSERLVVHCDAYYPEGSGITAYIRAKNDTDPEKLTDKQYTLMTGVSTGRSVLGETQDKTALVFYPAANVAGDHFLQATAGQLGTTGVNNLRMDNTDNIIKYQSSDGSIYEGINEFQLKLLFTKPDNSGTAYAPEISDLTAIAHDKPIEIT
jgi:hypothetical protein